MKYLIGAAQKYPKDNITDLRNLERHLLFPELYLARVMLLLMPAPCFMFASIRPIQFALFANRA